MSRKHIYYIFLVFYSLADVKMVVHEDDDDKLLLDVKGLIMKVSAQQTSTLKKCCGSAIAHVL